MVQRARQRVESAFSGLAETWASGVGVFIVLSIFIALGTTAAGGWGTFVHWMNSEKAAYWVQAIGAILAVVAAFTISNAQFRAAVNLEEEKARAERTRKYEILMALVDSALSEYRRNLEALRGDNPLEWYVRTSATELMKEYYDSSGKFSPLDMPSAIAARSLIALRDLMQAASWNAKRALEHGTKLAEGHKAWTDAREASRGTASASCYDECIELMADNLSEMHAHLDALRAEAL